MSGSLTLAGLIRGHRESTGDSFAMIAQHAVLSEATVRNLAIPMRTRRPQLETLEKLARALGQSLLTVRLADAMSTFDKHDEQSAERIAESLRGLSPQDIAAAAIVVQALKQH